jgi:hypothetical protein
LQFCSRSELLDTATLLEHVISQLVTKLQDLNSNSPTDDLKNEVGKVVVTLGYLKFDQNRVSIDSGYHDDADSRKSLNLVPVGLRTTSAVLTTMTPAVAGLHPNQDLKSRRHGKLGQHEMMQSLSDSLQSNVPHSTTTQGPSAIAGFRSEIIQASSASVVFEKDDKRMSFIWDSESSGGVPISAGLPEMSQEAETGSVWDSSVTAIRPNHHAHFASNGKQMNGVDGSMF